MANIDATRLNILIPIFNGVNTLDVNGPLDVLCNAALRPEESPAGPFSITTAGAPSDASKPDSNPAKVKAFEGISLLPDITFKNAVDLCKTGDFDIILVPGYGAAPSDNDKAAVIGLIQAFGANDNKKGQQKWLVSICVGAILAGGAGAFNGLIATTHWLALSGLERACKAAQAPAKQVVRKRWVDGGQIPPASGKKVPTRILSSGGISCGLDACLYLLQQILGPQKAVDVATMMDYHWNGGVEALFRPSSWMAADAIATLNVGSLSQQWTTAQTWS